MTQAASTYSPQMVELPMLGVYEPPQQAKVPRASGGAALKLSLGDDLTAEIARESVRLESAEPAEILRWATQRFAPRFTMATAFGPEGMVLIHMLADVAPQTPIFNLDTGYQFQETLELREEVKRRCGVVRCRRLP